MKYCSHCGAECNDDAIVCVKCGCAVGNVAAPSKTKEQKFALASMILGIVSIVFCWSPLIGIASSIVAIVLGAKARKAGLRGQATAGLVTGIIGLVLSVVCTIYSIVVTGSILWALFCSIGGVVAY